MINIGRLFTPSRLETSFCTPDCSHVQRGRPPHPGALTRLWGQPGSGYEVEARAYPPRPRE